MKNFVVWIAVWLCVSVGFAQEGSDFVQIKGAVLNNASMSGVNAEILIKNAETFKIVSILPTQNASGDFNLKLKRAPYYFIVELRGYQLYNELVDLTNEEQSNLDKDILLIPSDLSIPEQKKQAKKEESSINIGTTNSDSGENSEGELYTKSSSKDDLLKKQQKQQSQDRSNASKPRKPSEEEMANDTSIHVEIVNAEDEEVTDRKTVTSLTVPKVIKGQKEEVKASENAENVNDREEGRDNSFSFSLKQGFQFIDVNTLYEEGVVDVLKNGSAYDRVIEFMDQNPEIQLEIRGYADDGLINGYQEEIALRRAKNVETYFTTNGIDEERLTAIAFPTAEIELFIRTKRLWRQKHLVEFRILGDSTQEYEHKIKNSADYEIAYSISLPEEQVVDEDDLVIENVTPSSASVEEEVAEEENPKVETETVSTIETEEQVVEEADENPVGDEGEFAPPSITNQSVSTEEKPQTSEEESTTSSVTVESTETVDGAEVAEREEELLRTGNSEGADEVILDIPLPEDETVESPEDESGRAVEESVATADQVEIAATFEPEMLDASGIETALPIESQDVSDDEAAEETEEERLMRLRGADGADEVFLDLPGIEPEVATPETVEEKVAEAASTPVKETPIDEEVDLSTLVEEKQQEKLVEEPTFTDDDFKSDKPKVDGDKILSAYEKLLAETDEINSKVLFFEKKKSKFDEYKNKKMLDSIIHYLDAHPKVKINIVGYGSKKDGKSNVAMLAKQRAMAAMNYLIDQQIEKKRIKYKGGGLFNKTGEKMDYTLEQRVTFEIIPVKVPSGKKKPTSSASRGVPPKLKSRKAMTDSGVKSVTNYDDADQYDNLRTKEETTKVGEYNTKPANFPKLKTDDDYYDYLVENNNATTINSLSFKIQVGAYRLPLDKDAKLFKLVKDAKVHERGDGWYRYFSGNFSNIVEAEKAMVKIRKKKIQDAFVAAFFNGNKISMRKATEMLLRAAEKKK